MGLTINDADARLAQAFQRRSSRVGDPSQKHHIKANESEQLRARAVARERTTSRPSWELAAAAFARGLTGGCGVQVLCYVCLAAPISNVIGLLTAEWYGQTSYPDRTISNVIKASPGLNVVAAGWQVFGASYTAMCIVQHQHFQRLSQFLPSTEAKELGGYLSLRLCLLVATLALMSFIHLLPMPGGKQELMASPLCSFLHFCVAGAYAACGTLELLLMTKRIQPVLEQHGLEFQPRQRTGCKARRLLLSLSPAWPLIGAMYGGGVFFDVPWLVSSGSALEFVLISLYGCYPLTFAAMMAAAHRNARKATLHGETALLAANSANSDEHANLH